MISGTRLNAIVFALAAANAASTGSRQESIKDPSLDNMIAFTVNVPANWHFQGLLMQEGACVTTPFAVFRATSPDGLKFVEEMPTFGWAWGTGPAARVKHEDCLPLKQPMAAQEFLKYISVTLNVEYVAAETVPPDEAAKAQKTLAANRAIYAPKYAAMHIPQPTNTRELARATVRYKNGSFVMKGQLATVVNCTETNNAGVKSVLRGMPDQPAWSSSSCTATVHFTSTPEDKYQATASMLEAIHTAPQGSKEWSQAWISRNNQQTARAINEMNSAATAQRHASAEQFNRDQAMRQRVHEQFLSTMRRGTDMSMQRAAEVANSNHRMASDVVDYALDQQSVRDPNTGQFSKVSSAYSYTWVDSTGKTSFQTNDVNANPNGSLQGNWTRQQVVHGDGSDK